MLWRFRNALAPLALGGLAIATAASSSRAQHRAPEAIAPEVSVLALPDGGHYTLSIFRFALAHTHVGIRDLGMSTDLESARASAQASLAINAGFFSLTNEPEGVAISDRRQLSAYSHGLGGGVVAITRGVARLLDGETLVPRALAGASFAVQCRPRLVLARTPNVHSDDGHRADRTALCLRDGGRTLDVIVARTDDPLGSAGPTLYAFSRELVARGCENALNLDGGPSTGAAWLAPDGAHALPPRMPVRQAIVVGSSSSSPTH